MTDQLPQQLTDLFESTAGSADIPRLPLDEVLARGRRVRQVRRRRTAIWTAAAAAVAVVAVSLPLALAGEGTRQAPAPAHHPHNSPPPDTSSVSHIPTTLPYMDGSTLHARGQTFDVGDRTNLVSAGGTVLVGHWGKTITWQTLRGGRLEALPYGTNAIPVLSPDGRQAVVSTNPTPQTSRLTIYDTRSDREVTHLDLDLPATCCDGGSIQSLGMDVTGTVYWVEQRGRTAPRMAWRPGNAPVKLPGDGNDGVVATPAGLIIGDALGRVVEGRWQKTATVRGEDDAWSPTGKTVAEGGRRPEFLTPATGRATAPSLPGELDRWIAFESDTDVLGTIDRSTTAELVRCNVATGHCVVIAALPSGWQESLQWATSGSAATAATAPTTSVTTVTDGRLSPRA